MTASDNITGHYSGDGEIGRRIDEQLRLSGVANDHTLLPSDVAAVDQFHVGGLEATQDLARLFSPSHGSYVLDIGSGLGGPSRYLAANYGCRVIGIDITEEYCRVASALGARMGLEDRGQIPHPQSTPAGSTHHRMFHRENATPGHRCDGIPLVLWNDVTEGALRFLDAMVARSRTAETPRLGLHLVLGSDFPEMARNSRRNLEEERCGVVQAVFQRVS